MSDKTVWSSVGFHAGNKVNEALAAFLGITDMKEIRLGEYDKETDTFYLVARGNTFKGFMTPLGVMLLRRVEGTGIANYTPSDKPARKPRSDIGKPRGPRKKRG